MFGFSGVRSSAFGEVLGLVLALGFGFNGVRLAKWPYVRDRRRLATLDPNSNG